MNTLWSIVLWDDTAGACIGRLAFCATPTSASLSMPLDVRREFTPAAGARVYSIRAWSSVASGSTVYAGSGGASSQQMPAFIRITKA